MAYEIKKVQPEENLLTFKKPIRGLTAWDATYLKRKAEVGEKFFACKSGRHFCYFTDGAADPSQDDVAVVLCLHGASQNKTTWLLAEPLTGIFQIAVDRFGTTGGSSSTPPDGYSFAEGCKELLELVDGVYAERSIPPEKKFFVTGHSMGGTWAIEMAACPGVCDRIEAIAPISSPSDVHNPNFSCADMKKVKELPGFMKGLKKKGCCGAINRCFFFQLFHGLSGCKCKGRTGDYGMAAEYEKLRAHTGGDERGRTAMDADPFFITQSVDSFRGFTTSQDSFNEWSRCWSEAWSYDIADVKVPCFIYNGEAESTELVHAEFIHRSIKGSELTVWPGHGHLSIALEYRRILEALAKKQKVEGGPCFPT